MYKTVQVKKEVIIMANPSIETRAVDFYKLTKVEFVEQYTLYEYMCHKAAANLIKELITEGVRPSYYRIRKVLHCSNPYAKEFVKLTLEVMEMKGLI